MPSSSTLRVSSVSRFVMRAKSLLRTRCAMHLRNDSQASLFVHRDWEASDSDALSILLTGRSCNAGDRRSSSSDHTIIGYPVLEDNDSADFHLIQPSEPAESVRSVSPVPSIASSMNDVTDSDNDDDTPALILDRDNSSAPSEHDEDAFYPYYPCDSVSSLKAECGQDECLVEETMPCLRLEDVDLSDVAAAAFKWLQRDECSPLTA